MNCCCCCSAFRRVTGKQGGAGGASGTCTCDVKVGENGHLIINGIDSGLPAQGKDGLVLFVTGGFSTFAELMTARPTGNPGELVVVGTQIYQWDAEKNEWKPISIHTDNSSLKNPFPAAMYGVPGPLASVSGNHFVPFNSEIVQSGLEDSISFNSIEGTFILHPGVYLLDWEIHAGASMPWPAGEYRSLAWVNYNNSSEIFSDCPIPSNTPDPSGTYSGSAILKFDTMTRMGMRLKSQASDMLSLVNYVGQYVGTARFVKIK